MDRARKITGSVSVGVFDARFGRMGRCRQDTLERLAPGLSSPTSRSFRFGKDNKSTKSLLYKLHEAPSM